MGMAEDMQMLKYLQQNAGHGQMPQQGMQQPMGGMMDMIQPPMQGMSPQGLEQQQMQQQPQRPNPLQAGSMAAVEAAKRSLEMSENENRRALGRAMIGMMSGMSQAPTYGQGLAGNLGALTAGFAPALSAYDAERDRIMQMNHALQVQQKQEEMLARKEEREMKKMAHEMDIANKRLGVEQGYFGLKQQEMEHEKKMAEEMSRAGAYIPLHMLSPMQHTNAMNNIKSYLDKREAAIPALESINTIENILTKNPDVTKHWGTIVLAAQRNDPTLIGQQLGNRVPERTRINAEVLSKSLSVLATSKFKGIPAKGLTVFAEKMIKEGSPSMDMHPKSILKMIPYDKKYLNHTVESGDKVYEELEKGIHHIPKPMKLELEKFEDEAPAVDLTREEAEAEKARIRAQLGI